MKKLKLTFALLLSLLCLHAHADQYFTDFQEFAAGNASTNLTGFTTTVATDWTATLVDLGAGDIALRFTNVGPTGDGVSTALLDAQETAGPVEAYAAITLGTTADQNGQAGPALCDSAGACYALRANATPTATTWRLAQFSNAGAVSASIGTAFAFTEPTAGDVFHLVVGRDGATPTPNIYAFAWLDGGSRPGSPQTSGGSSALTTLKPGVTVKDSSDDPQTIVKFGAGNGGSAAPEAEPPPPGPALLLRRRRGP